MLGGITLGLIYLVIYADGDTINFYNQGASVFYRLFYYSPIDFVQALFQPLGPTFFSHFNSNMGDLYYTRDPNTFFVIRLLSPLNLVAFNNYFPLTVLVSVVCYTGVWKLYVVFTDEFPGYEKHLAWLILFVPSVLFWGSGILKDSFTMSAVGWYTYALHSLLKSKREKPATAILYLAISIWILTSLKPYIFLGLLPGSLLWLSSGVLDKIQIAFIRHALVTMFIVLFGAGIYQILLLLGDSFGKYSVQDVLERAVITQQDLKRDYYGGNTFDIGDFEADPVSMLKKAPAAITAGLFRPFIYEARNIVMVIAGLESVIYIYLLVRCVLKSPWLKLKRIFKLHKILQFGLIFFLFFGFSVGISTSNFGSLVRYRIPLMPFLGVFLYILPNASYIIENDEIESDDEDLEPDLLYANR